MFESGSRSIRFSVHACLLRAIFRNWPTVSPFATFLYASDLNLFDLSLPGVSL